MMKKIRIATLLGASFVAFNIAAGFSAAVGGAVGQGPTLSLGGSVTGAAIGVNQKVRLHGNPPAVTFMSKGNLVMNVGGEARNGTGYGAVGVLMFDRAKSEGDRIDEAYIFMNHDCFGNVKLGDTEGIVSTMMYTGADVLGGLGGTNGDLAKFINMTNGVDFRPSISPAHKSATKLVWVSPSWGGFQVGFDFTPSTKLRGRLGRGVELTTGSGAVKDTSTAPYSTNLVGFGASYNKAFSKANLGLYAVAHRGKSRNDRAPVAGPIVPGVTFKNTEGYQIGALVDYQDWQMAGSWFDNKKSLIRKPGDSLHITGNPIQFTNTQGFDVAVAYDFARNATVAVGYTHTSRKVEDGVKAKADVTAVTIDYVVAPGWLAFAELDHFRMTNRKAAAGSWAGGPDLGMDVHYTRDGLNTNNHGTALVVGTKIRF